MFYGKQLDLDVTYVSNGTPIRQRTCIHLKHKVMFVGHISCSSQSLSTFRLFVFKFLT